MGKDQTESGDTHWPFEQFNSFLEECMTTAKIKNRAELSRLTGISETQFSKWLYGTHRPSTRSLDVLGEVLEVPTADLMWKAGYRVGRTEEPQTPARTERPVEYRRLERLDKTLDPADQKTLRAVIAAIVDSYESRGSKRSPSRT